MISGTALKIMLQSFIGPEGMQQIDDLIASGAIGQIAEFATNAGKIAERLERIERLLLGGSVEPGAGAADARLLTFDGAGVSGSDQSD